MPQPKPITRLTDMEITEVSLVDRGAIREVFTVIKSEDGEPVQKTIREENGKWFIYNESESNKLGGPFDTREDAEREVADMNIDSMDEHGEDGIEKVGNKEVCDKLAGMSNQDFVSVMNQMMTRFKEINNVKKGGLKEMGEDQVKSLVTEVVGSAMDTVNKNFVTINKAIDEIQKKVSVDPKEEVKEDKKEDAEVTKAITAIGESVKSLTEAFASVSKTLETVTEKVNKISEMKIDEKIDEVSKRVEGIENQENSSNAVDNADVKKSDDNAKQVFWKSFVPSEQ